MNDSQLKAIRAKCRTMGNYESVDEAVEDLLALLDYVAELQADVEELECDLTFANEIADDLDFEDNSAQKELMVERRENERLCNLLADAGLNPYERYSVGALLEISQRQAVMQ